MRKAWKSEFLDYEVSDLLERVADKGFLEELRIRGLKQMIKKREYYRRPEVKAKMSEYAREYYSRPEVKARMSEYYSRPEVKARKREYAREYYRHRRKLKLAKEVVT